mmetsp:Transcript_62513/g.99121  ORF Transcript_62513/g.99121 Transcript_62513/m.99121 type:complete len:187 (-) Transcript_62513:53-613(-)|eukprot:CAMPEP_0169105614 /NCGR_PEP_ID=MMETSP1015-20121227/23889_1 /TAXON_ID=342587 /ORGANISM="Karlodinium micrum, Strain CCMP2283" /LENGTH=186 /DNA_ID=CAMNT_0009166983 /DNA_START=33 /DNA_END=593 /DNA_ORIENTATION=+
MPFVSCISGCGEAILDRCLSPLRVPAFCDESFFADENFNRRYAITIALMSVAGISIGMVAVKVQAQEWGWVALFSVIFLLFAPPAFYVAGYCPARLTEARRFRAEANELNVSLQVSSVEAAEQYRVTELESDADARATEFAIRQSTENDTGPESQQLRQEVLEARSAAYRARFGMEQFSEAQSSAV